MAVTVLLDQRIYVSYAQAWVFSGGRHDGDYTLETFDGQANGLCGAAQPGVISLKTATHTGDIAFRIERHSSEPPVPDEWEDIVEVSFSPTTGNVGFHGLDDDEWHKLDLPRGSYRVRYCIRGMDEQDANKAEESVDAYLLQFWLAEPAPDLIVRQTSQQAAAANRSHRPLTAEEDAEQRRLNDGYQMAAERKQYGDRVPNQRLRDVRGMHGTNLRILDMDLTFALAEADDATHRAVAAWAALRALEQAGLIDVPSVAPAVAALRRGQPVPPPFDRSETAWAVAEAAPVRTSVPVPPDGEREECPQIWASMALFHSTGTDSLTAVLEVVFMMAHVFGRDGYQQAFAALSKSFPLLHQ
jgi:hypothetical protein